LQGYATKTISNANQRWFCYFSQFRLIAIRITTRYFSGLRHIHKLKINI